MLGQALWCRETRFQDKKKKKTRTFWRVCPSLQWHGDWSGKEVYGRNGKKLAVMGALCMSGVEINESMQAVLSMVFT